MNSDQSKGKGNWSVCMMCQGEISLTSPASERSKEGEREGEALISDDAHPIYFRIDSFLLSTILHFTVLYCTVRVELNDTGCSVQ